MSLRKNIETELSQRDEIYIGRSESSDIQINQPMVSRNHARVFRRDGRYFIEDLNSTNGTYINNDKINSITEIAFNDKIFIGPAELTLQRSIDHSEKSLEVNSLTKLFPQADNIAMGIHHINFKAYKNEFIALMGPSGCGKSTLLKVLNRYIEADQGEIKIFGYDIRNNAQYNRLKHTIGFCQQYDDWLIDDLTVVESIKYAAKIRLGDNSNIDAILERMDYLFTILNLDHGILLKRVKDLSGGQKKRVAIAIEMLSEPQLLLLDEPTSPLDPETIGGFLSNLKLLAENRTIIMVTHKPEDLQYVDRVLFLGKGGYLVFDGSPMDLVLQNNCKSISDVYAKYNSIDVSYENRLFKNDPKPLIPDAYLNTEKQISTPATNRIKLLYWQFERYCIAKINKGMTVNFIVSFLLPVLTWLSLKQFTIEALFMMTILSIFIGLFNGIEELIYDRKSFVRERKINLGAGTYLCSKLFFISLINLLQVILIYFSAILVFMDEPAEVALNRPLDNVLFLWSLSIVASVLGLFISALSKNTSQAAYALLSILIFQILYGGLFIRIDAPVKESFSFAAISRWGMQGITEIHESDKNRRIWIKAPISDANSTQTIPTAHRAKPPKYIQVSALDVVQFYPKQTNSNIASANEDKLVPGFLRGLHGAYIALGIFLSLLFSLTIFALHKIR
jgi:ABC-type multidrug transport system ATPase subunit